MAEWGPDKGDPDEPRRDPLAEWIRSLRGKPLKVARSEFAAAVSAGARDVARMRAQVRRDRWAWLWFVVLPTAVLLSAVGYWR